MKAHEFTEVADKLYSGQNIPQEGFNRTMIGRWYYACYHEIKNWLESEFSVEFANAEGKTHEKITFCCNDLQRKHMDLGFSKLGRLIQELKNLRVLADYKLADRCRQFDVDLAKSKTADIYQLLSVLKEKY